MVCSICKGPNHNRRTCVRRHIEKAAEQFKESAGEAIEDTVQEKMTDAVVKELERMAVEEIVCETVELIIDCCIPGLGFFIKMTRCMGQATFKVIRR
jgi:hypothetical protein